MKEGGLGFAGAQMRNTSDDELVRVVAPHFVAGILIDVDTRQVVAAAPILHWAVGRQLDWLLGYFVRKGWAWEKLNGRHRT